MKYDDLPPAMQRQVRAKLAAADRPKQSRSGSRTGPGMPLTCRTCTQVFDRPTEGQLSKHNLEHGGATRFEMIQTILTKG
jgi:hypothetical protein